MARYSVFPLYGDANIFVVDAVDLLDALQKAFNVKLDVIANLQARTFEAERADARYGHTLFYGVVGALGTRPELPMVTLLCSATVITYSHYPDDRLAQDVGSVALKLKENFHYERFKSGE